MNNFVLYKYLEFIMNIYFEL